MHQPSPELPPAAAKGPRPLRILAPLAMLILVAAAAVFWWPTEETEQAPEAPPTPTVSQLLEVDDAELARAMERRGVELNLFRKFLKARIGQFDAQLENHQHALTREVSSYFEARKRHVATFADEADTWGMAFKSMFNSDSYNKDIRSLLEKHVISPKHISPHFKSCVESYLQAVANEEASLREDICVEVLGFQELNVEAAIDEEAFNRIFDEAVARLASQARWNTGSLLARSVASIFLPRAAQNHLFEANACDDIGKIATKWLTKETVGLINAAAIDEDFLQSNALRLLDTMRSTLTEGSTKAWTEHAILQDRLKGDISATERADIEQTLDRMRTGGQLGINQALNATRHRTTSFKIAALQELLGEDLQ